MHPASVHDRIGIFIKGPYDYIVKAVVVQVAHCRHCRAKIPDLLGTEIRPDGRIHQAALAAQIELDLAGPQQGGYLGAVYIHHISRRDAHDDIVKAVVVHVAGGCRREPELAD